MREPVEEVLEKLGQSRRPKAPDFQQFRQDGGTTTEPTFPPNTVTTEGESEG